MQETYVHASFDLAGSFVPRVPKDRAIGAYEDDKTPRICVSTDIRHALLAIPQAGEVVRYMQMFGMPVIIHAYYLSSEKVYVPAVSEVPDVEETKERWLLGPPEKVLRRDYELVDPLVLRHKCMDGSMKYGVVSTGLRQVKFQRNRDNLCKALGVVNKEKSDEAIGRYSFRTVIQILGEYAEGRTQWSKQRKEGE